MTRFQEIGSLFAIVCTSSARQAFVRNCLASLIAIAFLILVPGCPSIKNATVEHGNVCIDLSPDGKTLVFSSADGDLYLFDIAASTVTRLTDTDRIESYPSFSPDGKQITFAATENASEPSRIYVLSLEDHSIHAVTEGQGQCDILPRFTPNGKQIVFARASQHRPYSLGGWVWDKWDVCLINADGTKLSRLTEEGYDQIDRIVPSSDENFIYAADSLGTVDPAILYKVSPNEKPTQLVPEPGTHNRNIHAWAADPMVSPDGSTIVFCSDRTKPFWYDVCVETGDANPRGLVGSKSRHNRFPDFTPDGQRIVFLAGTESNASNRSIYSLWEVTLSGETRELATSDLFTDPAQWQPPNKPGPNDGS